MKQPLVVVSCLAVFVLVLVRVGLAGPLQGVAQRDTAESAIPISEPHGFSVKVAISEKAKKMLAEKAETVVVAAYISGSPKQGALRRYVSNMGEIELGQAKAEVAPGEDANFGEIKLRQDALKQIDNQGPLLLINVFSGRKSSKYNLLDCGLYEGPLKAVKGKSIDIVCKLIEE